MAFSESSGWLLCAHTATVRGMGFIVLNVEDHRPRQHFDQVTYSFDWLLLYPSPNRAMFLFNPTTATGSTLRIQKTTAVLVTPRNRLLDLT